MKNQILKICDVNIHPGETINLALPLPEFNSCTSFFMPIKVVHGKTEGPCVLIFSGLTGDELNGIEIINRIIKDDSIKLISGTFISIPIINIPALINPNFNSYEKKFEDCFPGCEKGGYGERIAQIFTQEILSKANYIIELKTGGLNDDIFPQIYADISNLETKKLAEKFAAPVINHTIIDSSLHNTAKSMNIPLLVYKAGEARRFDESAIAIGKNGIINFMNALNMITQKDTVSSATTKPVFSLEQEWQRAHRSGILVNHLSLGNYVKINEILGHIQDPFNPDIFEPVKAAKDGIIVGINRNPLIFEGQNIFKLASFIDNNRAEISLEEWICSQEKIANEK